jgi:Tfp pilus assembly protein FimV
VRIRTAFVHSKFDAGSRNRALAAQAQKLTEQIKQMTARIKDLEVELEAARALQVSRAYEKHTIPPSEQASQVNTQSKRAAGTGGTLIIGAEGQACYHGETAGSEVCKIQRKRDYRLTRTCSILPTFYL